MSKKSKHLSLFYQIKVFQNIYLIIFFITLFFYLPVIINPALILNRDNDLQQQFWPIFHFIKQQFWLNGEFPLWNNLFFSGLPLLPDPQFSLFYPPNFIFLFLPANMAFILYFFIHTFIGGLGIYLIMKKFFVFSKFSSLFSTFAYITAPRLAGYLEAGHSGLVASWGLLPWVTLATFMLAKNPTNLWTIVLGVSLAGIFFTHTITFAISFIGTIILFLILIASYYPKYRKKSTFYYLAGLFSTLGLTAITLLPQLEWTPQTTRFLLLQSHDVYPQWFSKKEFFLNILIPYVANPKQFLSIDTEKWLSLGLITSLLAILGFWQLKFKTKIIITFSSLCVILISLNNASPIYQFLIKIDWYLLARVATRLWFIPMLLVSTMAAFGLETLIKRKAPHLLIYFLVFLSLAELLFLSWSRFFKPLPIQETYVPTAVYQFLSQDKDRFRVFCAERCFSQQEAAKANLELIEGYNTLQQNNYYKHMWQLSGGYWNYYTLSLPPQGNFKTNKLQPDALSLGAYNTKYVLSAYPLKDKNFIPEKQFGQFTIYSNTLFKTRAYFKNISPGKDEAPISRYSPNYIRVDTSKHLSNQIVLSEVYSKGWEAYLDGKEKTDVLETPVSLRLVNIKPDTNFVDFRYQPGSFMIGKIITLVTIFLLATIPFIFRKYQAKK